jgi:inhibitor of KinA
VPRKVKPENVLAGSVGIANGQTGIYPLNSPGGWQIIGRTPLRLFDPNMAQPVKLKAGQTVQFQRISINEFNEMSSAQSE